MSGHLGFSERLRARRAQERADRIDRASPDAEGRCPACGTLLLEDDETLAVGGYRYHARCGLSLPRRERG